MKLVWSLPELDDLDDAVLQELWQRVGGHPRTLEYVDALLNHGRGRLPDITRRLHDKIENKLGQAEANRWFTRERTLDAAIADAITVVADDIVLPELLATLSPDAKRLLLGVSVFREPVAVNGLLYAVGIPDDTAAYAPDRQAISDRIGALLTEHGLDVEDEHLDLDRLPPNARQAGLGVRPGFKRCRIPRGPPSCLWHNLSRKEIRRLCSPSLAMAGRSPFVRRWTAAGEGYPQMITNCSLHDRAADYWLWQRAWPQDRQADIHDCLEARYHLLSAGDLDQADTVTEWICRPNCTPGDPGTRRPR